MKIVLEHLTKKFPARGKKGEEVTAVRDFTFEIPDGSLIGLLGPSGCGKSTALNLLCGLEAPTEGKIYFGDTDVTDMPPELRGVGMVFQNYALYPHLTVRQNILFPLENLKGKQKLSKEEMNRQAEKAAGLVQIQGLMDRKPRELSGGQQQRVAIARALVKTPNVLLWAAQWFVTRPSSCSTSLCLTWTPACGSRPGRRSGRSSRRPESPPFSSPTTRRRP